MQTTQLMLNVRGVEGAGDIFGIWQPDNRVVSFDSYPSAALPISWQVEYSADISQAELDLDASAAELSTTIESVSVAEKMVSNKIIQMNMQGSDIFLANSLSEPDIFKELDDWRLVEELRISGQGVSFIGGEGDYLERVNQSIQDLDVFLKQLKSSFSQSVFIRSISNGRIFGTTSVSLSGNIRTIWQEDLGEGYFILHKRSVHLALKTRQAWMRLAAALVSTAVQIAALLPTGPAAAIVLPLTFRVLRRLVEDINDIRRE